MMSEEQNTLEVWRNTYRLHTNLLTSVGFEVMGTVWQDGYCFVMMMPPNGLPGQDATAVSLRSATKAKVFASLHLIETLEGARLWASVSENDAPQESVAWLTMLIEDYYRAFPEHKSKPN